MFAGLIWRIALLSVYLQTDILKIGSEGFGILSPAPAIEG